MPLLGTVAAALDGAHGFDTNTVLSSTKAKQLHAAGFVFCIRYLSRGLGIPAGDLSAAEADRILAAGLALMAVQHVAQSGWSPNRVLGTSNGSHAASNAQAVGFPAGVNVWLDLEGVIHSASHEDVIQYCNAWFDEVDGAGYVSGIYVGASAILSGDELFWRLKTRHYWRSGSSVPEIPQRGYQMVQRIVAGDKVAGVEIDRDLTRTDQLGGKVLWLVRN